LDTLFLDANILFSAAYRENAGLCQLWKLPNVKLVTSTYALEETKWNLSEPIQKVRLDKLIGSVEVLQKNPQEIPLPKKVHLPTKDRPILQAAIHVKATHLITGDLQDFGPYLGQKINGVLIVTPRTYLNSKGGQK
jgi:predicted nucleic acid-binding protein